MIIKVCGMRDSENIIQLSKLPIDYMGFIFYEKSLRFAESVLSVDVAKQIPFIIKKVGVFVNSEFSYIKEMVDKFKLQVVQLHGDESVKLCKELKSQGLEVWKAFQMGKKKNLDKVLEFDNVCDKFVFDTPSVAYGGSGQKFDWQLLGDYNGNTPFLLSGGIGPADLDKVMEVNHPKFIGIDINSRFESAPAMKKISLLEQFIVGVRFYD